MAFCRNQDPVIEGGKQFDLGNQNRVIEG